MRSYLFALFLTILSDFCGQRKLGCRKGKGLSKLHGRGGQARDGEVVAVCAKPYALKRGSRDAAFMPEAPISVPQALTAPYQVIDPL